MKATDWEFTNRAVVFGLIFAVTFPLYALDQQNASAAVADWLAPKLQTNGDLLARLLFGFGAFLTAMAALVRTWASAYLNAGVVYAAEVKTASLVADGPYRRVRNPLYFGNVLMVLGMATMMSRIGFVVAVVLVLVFCYRLIFREESELSATQGDRYDAYCKAVPRLWPSPWARISSGGRLPQWSEGLKAESWCWGFALAVLAFAITLNLPVYFGILGLSLASLWLISSVLYKKVEKQN